MRVIRKLLVGVTLLAAVCLLLPEAYGQFRAGVQGTVVDPSGAIVSGATLTLTSKDTGKTYTAVTDSRGSYSFPGLAPGNYSVTVEQSGFKKKVIQDVAV